ncbi:MAG: hypothetical protein WAM11_06140 [Cyanobium sp.]
MHIDDDCWHQDHASVTVEMVIDNLRANASLAQPIVRRRAGATRRHTELFTAHYWGALADAAAVGGAGN